MSYFERTQILAADSPSIDAFGRWRVSSPTSLFDSKQLSDSGSFTWAIKIIGNASASYNSNIAGTVLTASGSNSAVIRQSKRRFNYQPGKSQLVITTGNFRPPRDGVIKRMGYFDEGNGMYFVQSGSTVGIGLRSSTSGTPVNTVVSQSDWNLDRVDGSGPSGKTLDFSKSQIYFFDFEWLGVGRVRYGIFQSGQAVYVHEINNVNSLDNVYMTNPNLPVRYEVINSGSISGSMLTICSTVTSEGGHDNTGTVRSVDTISSSITVNSNILTPLLAIRLRSGSLGATIKPAQLSTICPNQHRYSIHLNPSTSSNFTGWTSVFNSSIEYAIGSGGTTLTSSVANEGTKIMSGFVAAVLDSTTIPVDTEIALGSDVDGNQDVFVLCVMNHGNASTAGASLMWREAF